MFRITGIFVIVGRQCALQCQIRILIVHVKSFLNSIFSFLAISTCFRFLCCNMIFPAKIRMFDIRIAALRVISKV